MIRNDVRQGGGEVGEEKSEILKQGEGEIVKEEVGQGAEGELGTEEQGKVGEIEGGKYFFYLSITFVIQEISFLK